MQEKSEELQVKLNTDLYLETLKNYKCRKILSFQPLEDAFNQLVIESRQQFLKEFQSLKKMQKLREASDKDLTLRVALDRESPERQYSEALIKDLLSLHKFHRDGTAYENDRLWGESFNISICNFYEKALAIRLSTELPPKAQAKAIINAANKEFHHRDKWLRRAADFCLILSCFAGVGLFFVAGRLCCCESVLFSYEPTKRESDLRTHWMMDVNDIEDNDETARLFKGHG